MKKDAMAVAVILLVSVVVGWNFGRRRNPANLKYSTATGMTLLPVSCSDLNGKPFVIDFSSFKKPTVLYVLNPDCYWCARNIENIKILAKARKDSFNFIGLSLNASNLKDYAESNQIGFPVFALGSYDTVRHITLGATPQTIVVTTDSKVEKNWIGAFTGKQEGEVEAYFGFKLPGLVSDSTARLALAVTDRDHR